MITSDDTCVVTCEDNGVVRVWDLAADTGGQAAASPATTLAVAVTPDGTRAVSQLVSTLERVGQMHNFVKGMGLAAPQINIGLAAAVIRTPDGHTVTLLNPRISDESAETDEQYEGCLSFFEVRGMAARPLAIEVEHQEIDGTTRITSFERGMARMVYYEVDHLFGVLYRSRMRPGIEPRPVSKYKGTGPQWTYR